MHLDAAWATVALTAFSVLLVPVLILMFRGAVKWTRTEDKLAELVDDVRLLMQGEDRVHSEMLAQMRIDRDATDKRLRFIEEFFMRKGRDGLD